MKNAEIKCISHLQKIKPKTILHFLALIRNTDQEHAVTF